MSAVVRPDAPGDPLVRVRGLDRAFEQGVERVFALRRIDLDVRRGDFRRSWARRDRASPPC